MKLSLFNKSLLFAGALAMVACSNDDFSPSGNNAQTSDDGAAVYMTLNVEMPTGKGTRSSTNNNGTSTDGTEVGTADENAVNSVLIVLADPVDNSFIFAGTLNDDDDSREVTVSPVPSTNSYRTTVKFQKSDLAEYYKNATNFNVNVFAFCNPPGDFSSEIAKCSAGDTDWYDLTNSTTETTSGSMTNPIWEKGSFAMSNSTIEQRTLPSNLKDWDNYNTAASAFDLSGINSAGHDNQVNNSSSNGRGAVKVERLACRFDFMDGSGNETDPNTYHVVKGSDGKLIIDVELTKMMLTNMAKKYYMLPRVSATGYPTDMTLCGPETKTNYLVGPNWNVFNKDLNSGFADYFNFPLFKNDKDYNIEGWQVDLLTTVLDEDQPKDNLDQEYTVWRYATENVIPSPVANQEMGKSTIIVFKGKLKVNDEAGGEYSELRRYLNNEENVLTGNPDQDPLLYSYNGSLYFTWEEVRNAAINASVRMNNNMPATATEDINLVDGGTAKLLISVNRSTPLYIAVFGTGGMGKFTWGETEYGDYVVATDAEGNELTGADGKPLYELKPQDSKSANYNWNVWDGAGKPFGDNDTSDLMGKMRAAVTGAGFTIYQSSRDNDTGDGYYCYYFYKNRHNDNNDPGQMGEMEFATVRNNVYKLAVTNISQLGHPRIPQNDPDNPEPDTPDETDDVYLTVTCRVLDWAVRVNNIEF